MLQLKPEQYTEVIRISDKDFDINIDQIYRYAHVPDFLLINAINDIELERLRGFLEYKYKNTSYKTILIYIFDEIIHQASNMGKDKINHINDWIKSILPFDQRYKIKAHNLFIEELLKTDDAFKIWEEKLFNFLAAESPRDIILFLDYGKQMLEEGLNLHLISCDHPHKCFINTTFENKKDTCNKILNSIEKESSEIKKKKNINPLKRINWLGTQKELAELFIELKKKGWIEKFEYDTIKNCFTESNTIHQVLKPGFDPDNYQRTYNQVYTSQYSPKFFGIKKNPK